MCSANNWAKVAAQRSGDPASSCSAELGAGARSMRALPAAVSCLVLKLSATPEGLVEYRINQLIGMHQVKQQHWQSVRVHIGPHRHP